MEPLALALMANLSAPVSKLEVCTLKLPSSVVVGSVLKTDPEARLKEMIDEVIFGSAKSAVRPETWEGKAGELERLLVERD